MTDHVCEISYSKDGGHNFTDWTQHDLGAVGRFQKRVSRTRLGQSRDWVFRIRVSSPRKSDLLAASAKAELDR